MGEKYHRATFGLSSQNKWLPSSARDFTFRMLHFRVVPVNLVLAVELLGTIRRVKWDMETALFVFNFVPLSTENGCGAPHRNVRSTCIHRFALSLFSSALG